MNIAEDLWIRINVNHRLVPYPYGRRNEKLLQMLQSNKIEERADARWLNGVKVGTGWEDISDAHISIAKDL